ncbi:MAG: hypothetical protein IKZ42_07200 [Clostridiales bacterium]|nr:hypothetical protein [Clostridiales bacterium]
MKKFGTVILTAAIAVSMIAGCGNKLSDTDPSAATGLTSAEPSVSADVSAAETSDESPKTFEELYGNQIMTYMNHQYYFEGEALLQQESNFYFINAFVDLSGYANMGYYPSTPLGFLDLAAEYDGDEYKTYGDYYVYYAENSIESTCILCARAKAEGVSLDDETMKQIDDMIVSLKTEKAPQSGLSFEEYLQLWYGPGMDEASFRKVVERYFLADAYSKEYCANYKFTDEEKKVPYVRYALFYAPQTADQETKDKALAAANSMKDACKTIDDLTGLSETALADGSVMDQGDIAVPKGQMVKAFEEWSYGKDRKEGELDVIYAVEYGYFVVGYLGLKDVEESELNNIALKALSDGLLDEIKNKKHDFHGEGTFGTPPAAPTATPAPDATDAPVQSIDPNATVPSGTTQPSQGNMSTTDVLIVVFFTLAGVAILAVIVILINYAIKNNKNGSDNKPVRKPRYDEEDEDEEEEVKPAKSKSSKKASEPEEDEEDEDGDEEDDEEEE